jgi:hypothetical protein
MAAERNTKWDIADTLTSLHGKRRTDVSSLLFLRFHRWDPVAVEQGPSREGSSRSKDSEQSAEPLLASLIKSFRSFQKSEDN